MRTFTPNIKIDEEEILADITSVYEHETEDCPLTTEHLSDQLCQDYANELAEFWQESAGQGDESAANDWYELHVKFLKLAMNEAGFPYTHPEDEDEDDEG